MREMQFVRQHNRVQLMSGPHDLPLAIPGLTSYRCRGKFGWIMIGANDVAEALREAARSERDAAKRENLQVWNGRQYIPVAT